MCQLIYKNTEGFQTASAYQPNGAQMACNYTDINGVNQTLTEDCASTYHHEWNYGRADYDNWHTYGCGGANNTVLQKCNAKIDEVNALITADEQVDIANASVGERFHRFPSVSNTDTNAKPYNDSSFCYIPVTMYNNLVDQLNIIINNKLNSAANSYPVLKADVAKIMPLITAFKTISKEPYANSNANPVPEFVKFKLTDITPLMQTYSQLYLTISNDFNVLTSTNKASILQGAGTIPAAFTAIHDIINQTPVPTETSAVAPSDGTPITMSGRTSDSISSDKYAAFAGLDKVRDSMRDSSKSLNDMAATKSAITQLQSVSNQHNVNMDNHVTAAQTAKTYLSETLQKIVNILQKPTAVGPKGATGNRGQTGEDGDVGADGDDGDDGRQGNSLIGPPGVMGIMGPQGYQGYSRPTYRNCE